MSVQFGRCDFDGKPVDPTVFDRVRSQLSPYGPDGEGTLCRDNFGVLYRAFHTTEASRRESQPHISESGAVITWDGRLDNREVLIDELGNRTASGLTDLEIVAASYDCWGVNTLGRLIGDWALSIWEPKDQSLTLAADFLGLRHLYYSVEKDQVTWCTIIDPLVLLAERTFQLEEEYIAGWLALFPEPHLTPYAGIGSVPPSCFVRLRRQSVEVKRYWDFDPEKSIRYGSDVEYEEHFRGALRGSIRQRLRSESPVLAELSGGMDSSSIVCMADDICGRAAGSTPRVDTLSYYDDSEPNWNEQPYFSKVEEKRGRTGCHIDVSGHSALTFDCSESSFASTPGSTASCDEVTRSFAAYLRSGGYRVLLSGVGGDEVTGGVPTPTPELADLFATCHLLMLSRQLTAWAIEKRRPWFHMLFETTKEFFPVKLVGIAKDRQAASWLTPRFLHHRRAALIGYETRLKFFDRLPSLQINLNTLDALRRQFACYMLPSNPTYERRYPYLDRALLEFLYAIPPEQLVRPGRRLSLMRRALTGIVPDEVLNRKRKAYVFAGLRETVLAQWHRLNLDREKLASADLGIVDSQRLVHTLDRVARGAEVPNLTLMRTLAMESWLRAVLKRGVLDGSMNAQGQDVLLLTKSFRKQRITAIRKFY